LLLWVRRRRSTSGNDARNSGNAEPRRQPPELVAYRRLRDGQLGGGARERQMTGCRREGTQGIEGDRGALHEISLWFEAGLIV
jgi:hypothetical protein